MTWNKWPPVLAMGGGSLERDWGDGKVSQGLHWTPAPVKPVVAGHL